MCFQVGLQNGDMQIQLNAETITDTVAAVNDTNEESTLVNFRRTTTSSIVASFRNGVSLTVSVSFGLLSFVATIPEEFQGNASGLLGNFNGDTSDDLTYPNETILNINSPDRLIHDFGQSCKI